MKRKTVLGILCCVAVACIAGGLFLLRQSAGQESSAEAHYGQTTEKPGSEEALLGQQESTIQPEQPAGTQVLEGSAQTTKPEADTSAEEIPARLDDPDVQRCVAAMEELKGQYLAALEQMSSEVKTSYLALPEEQRTEEQRSKMIDERSNAATEIEKECNASVNELLSELREALDNKGADLTPVSQIRKEYEKMKIEKKSEYMVKIRNLQG